MYWAKEVSRTKLIRDFESDSLSCIVIIINMLYIELYFLIDRRGFAEASEMMTGDHKIMRMTCSSGKTKLAGDALLYRKTNRYD